MPLTKMSPLLQKAANEGYAVGSFSVANMEMVLGVLKAVEETESPAIIQIAEVRRRDRKDKFDSQALQRRLRGGDRLRRRQRGRQREYRRQLHLARSGAGIL